VCVREIERERKRVREKERVGETLTPARVARRYGVCVGGEGEGEGDGVRATEIDDNFVCSSFAAPCVCVHVCVRGGESEGER